MEHVDAVVIGAGVVGLAVARALAMAGVETIVVESADMIGTGTSSRNSEVIHAGIYYPTGSVKATTCVAGKAMLYAYAEEKGVPYRRCGKLIVATSEAQNKTLEQIKAKAAANGVDDLTWLGPDEVRALEPEVACTGALLSPSTGIIDSHSLMLAYQGDAEDHGAFLAFNAPLQEGRITDEGFVLEIGGEAPMTLGCLHADQRRRPVRPRHREPGSTASTPSACRRRITPRATTTRWSGRGRSPIWSTRCRRTAGSACMSPSISAARSSSALMSNGSPKAPRSTISTTTSIPDAPMRSTMPSEPTIPRSRTARSSRAMPASARSSPARASPPPIFSCRGLPITASPGLVNLLGIESPGLTASLAIADQVLEQVAPERRRAA